MNRDTSTHTDGSAIGGPLREVFAVEMTIARGQCANCGRRAALADTMLFDRAPGSVVRCTNCEAVLLRLVRGPDRAWIDLRGLTVLEIPLPG